MKWLAKVRRYGGGEGVVGAFATRDEACNEVDRRNRAYQSNIYYVEKYDPKKVSFPTRPTTPKETP